MGAVPETSRIQSTYFEWYIHKKEPSGLKANGERKTYHVTFNPERGYFAAIITEVPGWVESLVLATPRFPPSFELKPMTSGYWEVALQSLPYLPRTRRSLETQILVNKKDDSSSLWLQRRREAHRWVPSCHLLRNTTAQPALTQDLPSPRKQNDCRA